MDSDRDGRERSTSNGFAVTESANRGNQATQNDWGKEPAAGANP